jgi:Skp family chaperone for outer membrane proteins
MILALLAAGAFAWFVAPVRARQPVAMSVGYVSSQRISAETTDGKAGVAKVVGLRRQRAAEVKKLQALLNDTTSQLAIASAEAAPALRQQEQRQRADLQRLAVQSQADVQRMERQQSAELMTKVRAVLDGLAKERRLQVILNSESAVVWGEPSLDLTSVVVERMNARAAPAPQ